MPRRVENVILICDGCGIKFERRPSRHRDSIKQGNTKFFCSHPCYRKRLEEKTCLDCGQVFLPKDGAQKFCSRSCSARYNNINSRIYYKCSGCEASVFGKAKYCSNECRKLDSTNRWLSGEVFPIKWGGVNAFIRSYLLELSGYRCSQCGWNEINPRTNNCPLEIDHIDGDSSNNVFENLRVLCPNCHSLTPTFRNLNNNKGRQRAHPRPIHLMI